MAENNGSVNNNNINPNNNPPEQQPNSANPFANMLSNMMGGQKKENETEKTNNGNSLGDNNNTENNNSNNGFQFSPMEKPDNEKQDNTQKLQQPKSPSPTQFDFSSMFGNKNEEQKTEEENELPKKAEDNVNNFYLNDQKQQHQQNNGFNSTVGSNPYDINREFFKIENKYNDKMIISEILNKVNGTITENNDLKKLEEKINKDAGTFRKTKQWKEGLSGTFTALMTELFKKIDDKGKIEIGDLEEWKTKSLQPLKNEIEQESSKDYLISNQLFLKKMAKTFDYINGKFKGPFDKDEFNIVLSNLHNVMSERLAEINDSIIEKIIVIIYDFFTGRRTFTELEKAKKQIFEIRENIESFAKLSETKDREIELSSIKDKLLDITSVCKNQKLSMKELNIVKQKLKKTLVPNIDGIDIVATIIIEFGQESIINFYQTLDKNIQNKIEQKVYNHYKKKYSNEYCVKNIVTEMLNNGKSKDLEKTYNTDKQKNIITNIFRGSMVGERAFVDKEFEDKLGGTDLVLEGIANLKDEHEVNERTKQIMEGINTLRQSYEEKISELSKIVQNAQTIGAPTPSISIGRIKGIITTFKNSISSIIAPYEDFYENYDQLTESERKKKLEEKKKEFDESNKKYEKIMKDLTTNEEDKDTKDKIKKTKVGKQGDVAVIGMILGRNEITKLKFDSWKKIKALIKEVEDSIAQNINDIVNQQYDNQNSIPIMKYSMEKEKIKNDLYETLLDKGVINSRKEESRFPKFQ